MTLNHLKSYGKYKGILGLLENKDNKNSTQNNLWHSVKTFVHKTIILNTYKNKTKIKLTIKCKI